jgi:hypothetical protein
VHQKSRDAHIGAQRPREPATYFLLVNPTKLSDEHIRVQDVDVTAAITQKVGDDRFHGLDPSEVACKLQCEDTDALMVSSVEL